MTYRMIDHLHVYTDIAQERVRQDEQWGGPAHDDQHRPAHWPSFIIDQIKKQQDECRGPSSEWTPIIRSRLVKIAALAVAGIEAIDRQAGEETS